MMIRHTLLAATAVLLTLSISVTTVEAEDRLIDDFFRFVTPVMPTEQSAFIVKWTKPTRFRFYKPVSPKMHEYFGDLLADLSEFSGHQIILSDKGELNVMVVVAEDIPALLKGRMRAIILGTRRGNKQEKYERLLSNISQNVFGCVVDVTANPKEIEHAFLYVDLAHPFIRDSVGGVNLRKCLTIGAMGILGVRAPHEMGLESPDSSFSEGVPLRFKRVLKALYNPEIRHFHPALDALRIVARMDNR